MRNLLFLLGATGTAFGQLNTVPPLSPTVNIGGTTCTVAGPQCTPPSSGTAPAAVTGFRLGGGTADKDRLATLADAVMLNRPNSVNYFAFGVTVNDGVTHPLSAEIANSASPFYQKNTLALLAAMALPDGTQPYYFLTDSGANVGPLGTAGNTTRNPFTVSGGKYQLTDAMVTNGTLSLSWLAAQAAALRNMLYIPRGAVLVNMTIMYPIAQQGSTLTTIAGDGQLVSSIVPAVDLGAGNGVLACGDPAATQGNGLGRYNGNAGQCSSSFHDIAVVNAQLAQPSLSGGPGVQMTGIKVGARTMMTRVLIKGFNHDRDIVGDQMEWSDMDMYGYVGDYYELPNTVLVGNLSYKHVNVQSQFSNFGVAAGATMYASLFGHSYLAAPFQFLGDAATGAGCTPIVFANINEVQSESTALAFVQDGTELPGQLSNGTSYGTKCRAVSGFNVDSSFTFGFTGSHDAEIRAAFPNYRRQHVFSADAAGKIVIDNWNNAGLTASTTAVNDGGSPAIGQSSATAGQTFAFNSLGSATLGEGGIAIRGNMRKLLDEMGSTSLLYLPQSGQSFNFTLEEPGQWRGSLMRMSTYAPGSTYTTTLKGDAFCYFAVASNPTVPCGFPNNGTFLPPVGFVMQSGLTASTTTYVPVAESGIVDVNLGWTPYADSTLLKMSTGIRTATFTPGSGGTAGTYNWTGSGGACTTQPTGTITVAGGSITGLSVTNVGKGCTSAPTIALPTGTGLTGASIATAWPSAMLTNAASSSDGPLAGFALQGVSGDATLGTLIDRIKIRLGW